MQYSPKLKKAMEEIKEIVKKYDIGALVTLHDPGNSEYWNHITPSYSLMKVNGDEIRLKANLKNDFSGNKQLMQKRLSDTANMLSLLAETSAKQTLMIMQVSDAVDKALEATHTEGGHTSHTQQNN